MHKDKTTKEAGLVTTNKMMAHQTKDEKTVIKGSRTMIDGDGVMATDPTDK